MLEELEVRQAGFLTSEQERVHAVSRLQELQGRAEQLERGADAERAAALEARAQLSRAESELRVARSSVATLEQQAAALRQQVQVGARRVGVYWERARMRLVKHATPCPVVCRVSCS